MIIDLENNTYQIEYKRQFTPHIVLSQDIIQTCFNFANQMTFARMGEHRDHRTGGNHRRKRMEIFADTFQGKIAEFGFYEFYKDRCDITEPDMSVLGLGEWDSADFSVNGVQVAVKSTKRFGNLLLLEAQDWDEDGNYIPNRGIGNEMYHFIFLVRVSSSCSDILKQNRLLYSDSLDEENVYGLITDETWSVEITGYITHNEFVNDVIGTNQIIPRNARLNGSTIIDANNYYVEAGNLHFIE